jgi:ubiquitin-conjugating enzyme E2 variant
MWNGVLDRNRVFEALEMVVFLRTGVRPRSWDETDAAWMEETGDAAAATAIAGSDSS